MYLETESDCFDPDDPYSIGEEVAADCVGFSHALRTMRLHDKNDPDNTHVMQGGMVQDEAVAGNLDDKAAAMAFGDVDQGTNNNNWEYHHHHHQVDLHDTAQNFMTNPPPFMLSDGQIPMTAPTPDLLDLFHNMPQRTPSALLHNPPMPSLMEPLSMAGYDPLLHLTPHPLPPLMRDLFHSLPQGCYHGTTSLFGDAGDDSMGMMYHQNHHQDAENGMLKFGADIPVCLGKRERKAAKHFTTDKEKRCQMNDKFSILMSLIPNPTKTDRASVVGDAIEYIKELLRTVNELKMLVEKKRCGKESRRKRHKMEEGDVGSCISDKPAGEPDHSYSSALRSSWLQRKSKVTEVDVRIIDDEVTIKLVQRKKINCLLYVSRVLDELQLDLQHVAGGHIGEHYSFLFNSKINEGSSVFASSIASKLIEAVDTQYAMSRPSSSY